MDRDTSFSDEDLKRWHRWADSEKVNILGALLARLDAAERVAQFAFISEHPLDDSTQEAYEAWQKSKRSTGVEGK